MRHHPTFPCGGGSRAFAPALQQKAIEIGVDLAAMPLHLLVRKPVNHLRRGRWGGEKTVHGVAG